MSPFEDLTTLHIFERIVATGSLSAAARELGLTLTMVSKRLATLEKNAAMRLVNRSTRQLSLTDEGTLFYQQCTHILSVVDEAESSLLKMDGKINGILRLSAPHGIGQRYVAPALALFKKQHPELKIHLSLDDEIVDLISGRYDMAIRVGRLHDSRLYSKPLVSNYVLLCASPDYLANNGIPESLDDLQHHSCINIGQTTITYWHFDNQKVNKTVKIHASVICDDGAAAQAMAIHGAGIIMKAYWDVKQDLESGKLVQVLSDIATADSPLNAVYLHNEFIATRTQTFIEFLQQYLRQRA